MKLALFYLLSVVAVTIAVIVPRQFKDGNDAFTSRMFYEIVKEKPQESVVLSAYSVLTPLAQLALASEGESHDELLKAIGMPNDVVTKEMFSLAASYFKTVKGVELKTASKIYIASKYKLYQGFVNDTRALFDSEIQTINFTRRQRTASEINAWVEDQTNEKIKDLVSPYSLDANTRAILVNAIYFKGLWKSPFNYYSTKNHDFYITKEKSVKIPMMYQKSYFKYADVPELDAKILQMFYEGNQASMVLVLPNEIDGLPQLEEKLRDRSVLKKATMYMTESEVHVTIPKFKIETTTNLKHVLSKMNVTKLFQPGEAHLCKMIRTWDDLFISEATQKAFIEIDEDGAEAAAANVLIGYSSSLHSPPVNIFYANRPFYFEIRVSDIPIFNGVKAK
ncbi:alaserpin-like [Pieris rapae]|uniref:alaserpin-like n=1 Tax=Pieris rapae TaxID=64459 RepID=UPI001E27CDF8|nr:alaserpin-like [Pieris rapae]